jgi:hypothetical protein
MSPVEWNKTRHHLNAKARNNNLYNISSKSFGLEENYKCDMLAYVVLELTSPALLRSVVLMESATNHFWPFITILYGGS